MSICKQVPGPVPKPNTPRRWRGGVAAVYHRGLYGISCDKNIEYDLSATDIMMLLGYVEKTGTEWIAKLEQDKNITLPQAYCSFMELAVDCPLLATSDLWVDKGKPTTLYEMIKEIIDFGAAEKA